MTVELDCKSRGSLCRGSTMFLASPQLDGSPAGPRRQSRPSRLPHPSARVSDRRVGWSSWNRDRRVATFRPMDRSR